MTASRRLKTPAEHHISALQKILSLPVTADPPVRNTFSLEMIPRFQFNIHSTGTENTYGTIKTDHTCSIYKLNRRNCFKLLQKYRFTSELRLRIDVLLL